MTNPTRPAALLRVAKRMVWFKPPEETLRDQVFFINHLMTYGTIEDVRVARIHYSEDDFRDAFAARPPRDFRSALVGVLAPHAQD